MKRFCIFASKIKHMRIRTTLTALVWLVTMLFAQASDIVRLQVERLPDLNVPRAGHQLFYVNGELTVAGGHTDGFVPTPTAEYYKDGKWHLLLYDMDATFHSRDSIYANLLGDWAAQ